MVKRSQCIHWIQVDLTLDVTLAVTHRIWVIRNQCLAPKFKCKKIEIILVEKWMLLQEDHLLKNFWIKNIDKLSLFRSMGHRWCARFGRWIKRFALMKMLLESRGSSKSNRLKLREMHNATAISHTICERSNQWTGWQFTSELPFAWTFGEHRIIHLISVE